MEDSARRLIPLGISAIRDPLPAEKLGPSIALMSASLGVGGALRPPLSTAILRRRAGALGQPRLHPNGQVSTAD